MIPASMGRPRFSVRILLLLFGSFGAAGCGGEKGADFRIFHAAGMTSLLESLRDDARRELKFELRAEGSGSQAACRKMTELKRTCDLLILADAALVPRLLSGACAWRLNFAVDEIVLGVGARAPEPERAEKDWTAAILAEGVRLGRADETLAPIGYRTLMVWQLEEAKGSPGLAAALAKKCAKVVDDVDRLCPLLKNGDLDYAFLYRSSCVAHDIRFIELDPAVNLGDPARDYSKARVALPSARAGAGPAIAVEGSPVAWTLCVPIEGADRAKAAAFAAWLLKRHSAALERHGFKPLVPARFFGSREDFAPFAALARHAGAME